MTLQAGARPRSNYVYFNTCNTDVGDRARRAGHQPTESGRVRCTISSRHAQHVMMMNTVITVLEVLEGTGGHYISLYFIIFSGHCPKRRSPYQVEEHHRSSIQDPYRAQEPPIRAKIRIRIRIYTIGRASLCIEIPLVASSCLC